MTHFIVGILHSKKIRLWIMLSGAILAIYFFAEVVDDVFLDPKEGDLESVILDRSVKQQALMIQSPLLTQAMTDLTALGSMSVIGVLFIVLSSVLITYRDYRGLAYLSTVLAGAGVIPTILKRVFNRPRPDLVDRLVSVTDLSFPSGHSFAATALYIALAYYSGKFVTNWRQEIFFYLLGGTLILLVGISRIYLGVHYATDVMAGISSGAAWALIVSAVFENMRTRKLPAI